MQPQISSIGVCDNGVNWLLSTWVQSRRSIQYSCRTFFVLVEEGRDAGQLFLVFQIASFVNPIIRSFNV